ncbi:MAG: glycosyltransferase family 39 protein, partial [Candidatus Zixiibacteriota bacterium]
MRRAPRIGLGVVFLVVSIVAVWDFESLFPYFVPLSTDGRIVPFMKFLLQLSLISLASIGVVLIFLSAVARILNYVDRQLCGWDVRTFLKVAVLVGLVLRSAAVVLMPFNQTYDYLEYDELGWEWASKGGYYRGEHPTAYRPPGYPFLLSRIYILFGHIPQLGAVANMILGLSIPLLTYFIVRRIWSDSVARWTTVIVTLFPSQIIFTHLLASELLFTPLFLASILLFLSFDRKSTGKWYKILAGGVLLGMATLTRTVSGLFLAIVIPFWSFESRNFKRTVKYGLLALVGFVVVVTPWIIRNHYAVGTARINTNTGINLFIGNQPGSGITYDQNLINQFGVYEPTLEAYVDSSSFRRACEYIRQNPGVFLRRGLLKVGYFYAADMDALYFGIIEASEQ